MRFQPQSMPEAKPRQRRFAPRSRTGCLTCRTRRKRCDDRHPQCANCSRLNLTCKWQTRQTFPCLDKAPEISSSTTTFRPANNFISPSLDVWDAFPLDQVAERKQLLQYYVEAFVPSVSVATTPSSFYTSLYMPWAFHVEGMLHAILAISSAQLARRTSDPVRTRHLKSTSCIYEQKCYSFIKERLPRFRGLPQDPYQVVAVILILVGLEALNGVKTAKWISKLMSVQRILSLLTPEQFILDCIEIDALHRHFTYHFASASVMASVTNVSSSSTFDNDLVPAHSAIIPTTIDPLMGISYQLCNLISRIQYITRSNSASPYMTASSFKAIESAIQSWSCNDPFAMGVDIAVALDLIALAEAYRLAALIQLYRSSPAHASSIPICASRAMEFVARIPSGSPAESSLLYPIFLAGAELDDGEAMGKCLRRLEDIKERNRYENVETVQRVLEEVWRSKLEEGRKRDWAHILREWNWSFTLG